MVHPWTCFAKERIFRSIILCTAILSCRAWLGQIQHSFRFLRTVSCHSCNEREKCTLPHHLTRIFMTHDHHDFKNTQKQHQHRHNIIHFGNHLDIHIKLPTSDPKLVKAFLSRPNNIISTIYDSKQAVHISPSTSDHSSMINSNSTSNIWRIRFADIHIPAIDVISPIIDIHFQFFPHNHTITMQSVQWTIQSEKMQKSIPHASSQSLSDHSCHLHLHGILSVDSSIEEHRSHLHHHQDHVHSLPHNKPRPLLKEDMVATKGYVTYQITAEKPKFLQKMPQFVVDSAIKIVQNIVIEFVKKKFTQKMIVAFQAFVQEQHDQEKHSKNLHGKQ